MNRKQSKPPRLRAFAQIFFLALQLNAASHTLAADPGSELLRQLASETLRSNPGILSAESDRQSSLLSRDAAWHQFLPTPSVSMDRADQPSRTALNQKTTIVRLQQPIWQGGRLTAALNQADAAARGSHQSWLSQSQLTLEQLIQTLTRHRQSRQRAESLNSSVSTHERLLQQVKRRVTEGLSPPSDLTVAESRLFSVMAEHEAAKTDVQQQVLQLARLLGRRLGEDEQTAMNNLPTPSPETLQLPVSTDEVIAQIAAQQPRVLKLETDREQLEHRIHALKANRLPQLSLRLDRIQGDITGTDHVAVISLNTSWGAGLSNEREIEALRMRAESTELDRLAEWQEAQRRIAALQQDLTLQRQRHAQLLAAQRRSEAFLASSERLYLTGRKAWLEVLNAAREVSASQTAASEALLQIWSNTELLRLIETGPLAYAVSVTQPATTNDIPNINPDDLQTETLQDNNNNNNHDEVRHVQQ